MRAISAQELRDLVPMADAVALMKAVFSAFSADRTISPLRTPINMPDGSGVSLFMPAFVPDTDAGPASSGAKIVSVYPGNSERGLPTITAIVILLNPATGQPMAIVEGGALTALRTGAVSGAATDLMAHESASVAAIIGAGAQGCTQAAAVGAVRSIDRLLVYDKSAEALNSFAERLRIWDPELADRVVITNSAEDAVRTADVICTATTSTTPVFDDAWLKEGAHINAVGAFTPEMQELPFETIGRARIVVDSVEAVLHEAGDLIQAIDAGYLSQDQMKTELGKVVDGEAAGRKSSDEITIFKSVGNAIQDMIVGGFAAKAAADQGVGVEIDFGS